MTRQRLPRLANPMNSPPPNDQARVEATRGRIDFGLALLLPLILASLWELLRLLKIIPRVEDMVTILGVGAMYCVSACYFFNSKDDRPT